MAEAVALALALAAAGTVAYWVRRIARAEAAPSRGGAPGADDAAKAASAAELSRFAQEILSEARLPTDTKLFDDILRDSVDRLLARAPGLSMAVWKRAAAGDELLCRTGALAVLSPDELRVPQREWEAAEAVSRGLEWRGNAARLAPSLATRGAASVRLIAWGRGALKGLLMAADAPQGRALDQAAAELDLLSVHFSAAAALALSLWEMERSKKRLEGGLSTLHQVASTITARRESTVENLEAVVSIVAKALNADLCAFLLLDEKTRELVVQEGAYGLGGDEGSLYRLSLDREEASSVRVFRSGAPFITGDAMNDPNVLPQFAKLWKCHSLIVVPLTFEGRRIGVMRVGSFQKEFFSREHVGFVELIAEEAVVLLEGAMLTRRLAETNERLAEVNRIKDDFVSTVSHEFKTPLTSIKGFTTVMLEETPGALTADQKRFLTIIGGACDRLTALVSDLLDIARLEGGARMEFVPVSVTEALRHCQEVHQWQADGRTIDLRVEIPEGVPQVRGDMSWLRQVLDNLFSNAIKFTPPGGKVEVSVVDRGDGVELVVADTGIGISAEDQAHIFEKFYRAKSRSGHNAPGTGLGLAIAKAVVEKHEGKLWFESELGRGSRFHLLLPAVARNQRAQRGPEQALRSGGPQRSAQAPTQAPDTATGEKGPVARRTS